MEGDSKKSFNVIFVLGGPGAGKGTQCELIETTFRFKHLSAGELLRKERQAPNSQYGQKIEKHLKDGSIVPVKITCSLLRKLHEDIRYVNAVEFKKLKTEEMETAETNDFLIDGFPRNKDNLDGWNEEMTAVANVKQVLFFNCPDEVCVSRCLNRGLTSGRSDDNVESLKKRIETYRDSTMPIIEHYRGLGLVSEINGDRSTEEVFHDVQEVLKKLNF